MSNNNKVSQYIIPNSTYTVESPVLVYVDRLVELLCKASGIDFTPEIVDFVKTNYHKDAHWNVFANLRDVEKCFEQYKEKVFYNKVEKVILDPTTD